jgi:general secretion pathway protein G
MVSLTKIRVLYVRRSSRLTWGRHCSGHEISQRGLRGPIPRSQKRDPSASSGQALGHPHPLDSGFTLIELMVVMLIIGILTAMAIPAYRTHVLGAKEAVLHEDLAVMRTAIDSYTVDKQKAPQTLDDLVTGGYLKAVPKDPITGRSDTWMVTQSDTLSSIDQTDSGIDDVHSGAQETALNGTAYNTW